MAIATLIAAGRLDDRLIAACGGRLVRWIDEGDAADVEIDRLDALPHGVDCVAVSEPRVKRLLVADMDSTIIGQECIDELADYAGVAEEVAAITDRAMLGDLDFGAALEARVALLKGLDTGLITRCLEERIVLNPGAASLVATMKAHGASTLLVSGGFHDFCDSVAIQAGFDRVVANRLCVKEGRLCGTTEGPVIDSAAKRDALVAARSKLGLAPAAVLAIGDGANDRAMIEEAGLGIAFHAKPALRAVADGVIAYHGLDSLLWVQGIAKRDWVGR